MDIRHIREMGAAETAEMLEVISRQTCSAGHEAILQHAALLIKSQSQRLENKTVDPEAIRALGFLEGIAFQIEDDVLYESVKDALGKISGVLK